MISTLKLCVLAAAAASCSALQIQTPTDVISQRETTIKWTNEVGDPGTWSFYLVNEAFNDNFGLANNVDPAPSQLTVTLPVVPGRDGYTWIAVNLANISDVYATSGTFSIADFSSSTTSAASTTGKSSTTSGGTSKTSTGPTTPVPTHSTTSNTIATLPNTNTNANTGSLTSSPDSAATTSSTSGSFNAASRSLSTNTGAVVLVLSAVAGAVLAL